MWWAWKGNNPDQSVVAFMNKTYPPDWTYADFAAEFRAEFYSNYDIILFVLYQKSHLHLDPDEWADIFAASGAKYVLSISL